MVHPREVIEAQKLEAATERAARDVLEQLAVIDAKHGPTFSSMHEGYAVLLEEVDELFDEVKRKDSRRSPLAMRREAIDIAVVALRIARGLDDARYGRVRDPVGDTIERIAYDEDQEHDGARWSRRVKFVEGRAELAAAILSGHRDDLVIAATLPNSGPSVYV